MDIVDRLLSRIKVTPAGCFEWQGAKVKDGYGHIRLKDKTGLTHRVSYETFRGPIPPKMLVCHRCDNPCCINPSHLFIGTNRDNQQDCIRKGRFKFNFGFTSKLTVEQVLAARQARKAGERYKTIAARYGVATKTIRAAIMGYTWKHIQ
jgi:hypothetical protein